MNKPADPIDALIARDVDALRAATERNLPSHFETTRSLRGALLARPLGSSAFRLAAWAWTAAAAGIALLLAFVPVSYPVLVGHEVALTVGGELPIRSSIELSRGLVAGVGGVEVRAEVDGAGTTFHTRVAGHSARSVSEAATAFAAVLRGSGIEARVAVSPWTVPRSGNLYGLASDRLWGGTVLVEVRGRSAAEIERDIAARLEAVGFSAERVVVEREAGRTDVAIRATSPDGRVIESETRRELSGPAAEDEPPVAIDLMEFADLDHLPLEQRREAIERRLRERGIQATVTLEDGELRIEAVAEQERR